MFFKEKQHFSRWFIVLIVAVMSVTISLEDYRRLFIEHDFTFLWSGRFWGMIIIPLAVLILLLVARLHTRIDDRGIEVRFVPLFVHRQINWSDIESLEVVKYTTLGWGIRFHTKYNIIYNAQGNKGLYVCQKNKKRWLVGTQKVDEMKKIVEEWEAERRVGSV